MVANSSRFYGSKIEFYTCGISLLVLIIQFVAGLVYGTKQIVHQKSGMKTILWTLCYLAFLFIVILFIFNGVFWNTDTGTFREFESLHHGAILQTVPIKY
jgi:cytochrome b561